MIEHFPLDEENARRSRLRYRSQMRSRPHTTPGIVHLDLKPGNMIPTKGGAKLPDFGLAKTGATVQLVKTAWQNWSITVVALVKQVKATCHLEPAIVNGRKQQILNR